MKLTSSFRKIAKLKHRIKVIQGSQGASKTYSILQKWILTALKTDNTELCTIVTDTYPNLRSGAIKDFEAICNNEGILYESTKTPAIFKINNFTFEFFSVDKETKGLGGRRDRLFINECNRIGWKIARQLIARTHKEVILDFNPSRKFWAHEQYVDTNDCDFIKLTYKDNEYLPIAEKESIERHAPWGAVPDPNYWRVYGLGEVGFVDGAIFSDYEEFEELPTSTKLTSAIGLDFGWTDPMGCTMVHFDKRNMALYWTEIFYASHADYSDFAATLKSHKSYNNQMLICDAAGAREITDLRKPPFNFKAIACDKSGGLASDIRRIKKYKLYIHKDSKNLKKEASVYRWQERNGEIIEYPIDKDNHVIDPGRYASNFLINIS